VIKTGTTQLPSVTPVTGMPGTWDLNVGNGSRSYMSADIQFDQFAIPGSTTPFSYPPNVVLSLAGISGIGGVPSVVVQAQNVQAEEFNIYVEVYGDFTLVSLWVTWIATDMV